MERKYHLNIEIRIKLMSVKLKDRNTLPLCRMITNI